MFYKHLRFIIALTVLSIINQSCEDQVEGKEVEKSSVRFSFQESRNKKVLDTTAIKKIVLSIEENGNPVHSLLELDVQNFNGALLTVPLTLPIGTYSLTEFLLLDDSNTVIYASPKEGSQLANLVNDPLPIEFTVIKDQTITVNPEVISTSMLTAEDFGYSSFIFSFVKTMQFRIVVQIFNENTNSFELSSAHLEARSGSHIDFNDSIPAATSIITVRDFTDSLYTLIVSKTGFNNYQENFSRDSLINYSQIPLTIVLKRINDNEKANQIFAGLNHTLLLKTDGTLWAVGGNFFGQLGDGTNIDRENFVQVMTDVKSASAGSRNSLVLKNDGTVWATGFNNHGQLGDGTTTERNTFVQILTNARSIHTSGSHSLILRTDSTLWTSGYNFAGQLGTGDNINRNSFVQVMTGVKSASAGSGHSLALKTGGILWGTGSNALGQLGDGLGFDNNTFKQLMTDVQSISARTVSTFALKTDGTLWAAGSNSHGQLGPGSAASSQSFVQIMTDVKDVTSTNHTMILKTDHTLWVAGFNFFGELGDGTNTNKNTFIQVITDVKSIYSGIYNSFIEKNDGSFWITGWNNAGQLGDGTKTDKNTFVQITF